MKDALYQETILEHHKRPHNHGEPEGVTHHASGSSPTCGDLLTVHLVVEEGRVARAGWTASACAIARASASLGSDVIPTLDAEAVGTMRAALEAALQGGGDVPEPLAVLAPCAATPARINCALLFWRTAEAALAGGAL